MRRRKYTDEQLIEAVKTSTCYNEVAIKLNLIRSTQKFQNYIHKLNLDISHFLNKYKGYQKENIFCQNSKITRSNLRKNLLKTCKYKCNKCKITKWQNKQLILFVNHKNRIKNDNRLENLELLCANCHQTNIRNNNEKYQKNKDLVINTIQFCKNYTEVSLKTGLSVYIINKIITENLIDIGHFKEKIKKKTKLLIELSQRRTAHLKNRLIEIKNNINCEICNQEPIWLNSKLIMILDHKNGIPTDNSEDNLRLICPNCDSTLNTFGSYNKKPKSE